MRVLVAIAAAYDCFPVLSGTNIVYLLFFFFFFNDTATTEIYTLSLHDALPILVNFVSLGDTDER